MIPEVAVGAIVAAVIAAGVSLISLIITKESKISEFRQEWVNALREDIASAISAVATINLLFGTDHQTDHKPNYVDAWSKTSKALALVELRLNVRESDHLALQGMLREAEALIRNGEGGQYNQAAAEDLQDRVVAQTQVILKREWDRVREGEPVFQQAKNLAAVSFALITAFSLFWIVGSTICVGSGMAKPEAAAHKTSNSN